MSPLLTTAILVTFGCYALAAAVALTRVLRGPLVLDRVLALDLLYVYGLLIMMVLGIKYDSDAYFEGALLIALLGFVSSAAMAKFILRGEVIE